MFLLFYHGKSPLNPVFLWILPWDSSPLNAPFFSGRFSGFRWISKLPIRHPKSRQKAHLGPGETLRENSFTWLAGTGGGCTQTFLEVSPPKNWGFNVFTYFDDDSYVFKWVGESKPSRLANLFYWGISGLRSDMSKMVVKTYLFSCCPAFCHILSILGEVTAPTAGPRNRSWILYVPRR